MSHPPYHDCLNAALRLLARRDHSCKELSVKLRQRGFDRAKVQETIDACRRLNYLDDRKYSGIYTRQLQRKGYGLHCIHQKLHNKGVSKDVIAESLTRYCDLTGEIEACRQALTKKLNSDGVVKDGAALRPRLYRFLSGRGFSSDIIRQALQEALP